MNKGKLLLLPNFLGDASLLSLPLEDVVISLDGLIAESEKGGRKFLRRFSAREMPIRLLNEHTPPEELHSLVSPLKRGEKWGLVSDAGLPCIADPGSDLVSLAREEGIEIETFAGPCSILFALQLSGFSGQCFAFHGYLPRDPSELRRKIGHLEKEAKEATQIWIETPYRSVRMLEILKEILHPTTRLCIALNLTLPEQRVFSFPLSHWKGRSIEKAPAVFLISGKRNS